ncbi:hypothetical protein HNR77_003389 [Paenibacillus sp. JGP012]|uniref:hypothetical protein n=1 Tax=Paenibacillus sp. JGP012 TaxID=2735914 RepID=UPI00161AEFD6|nr:hypothetical protein [Paenibacillus sp. JGP012]MBB6022292.1 hypothetical protein [Paenibacillus sp. JGP012]
MDSIQFKVEYSEEQEASVISIYVNDESLIERMKRYEAQFESEIADLYEGLNIDLVDHIEAHFTGRLQEDDIFNYEGKTLVLGCNCGLPGCWPLLVKITEIGDSIIWSHFEQPHRTEDSAGGYWDYSNFRPLHFHKRDYIEQLNNISRSD